VTDHRAPVAVLPDAGLSVPMGFLLWSAEWQVSQNDPLRYSQDDTVRRLANGVLFE
jgi:hypothetical protein